LPRRFPTLGGYFSKDRILLATFIHSGVIYKVFWAMGMFSAFLTSLYTFRMFFIAFLERPDGRKASEIRPIPGFMQAILIPLAVVALGDGLLNLPFGIGKQWLARFLSTVPGVIVDLNAPSGLFFGMAILSAFLSLSGIALARLLYRRPKGAKEEGWHALLFYGFYLDDVYRWLVVRPYRWAAGMLWQRVDERSLDKGLETLALSFESVSMAMRLWTTGRISTYLKAFLVGLVGLLCLFAARVIFW